jgi:hypothetical protein
MVEELHPYLITAYSEWEVLDVEARCRDDEHAASKARRYGSLRHINRNFPAVIFSHIVRLGGEAPTPVGTWEHRLRGDKAEIGFRWHRGDWAERPDPEDKAVLRTWIEAR